MSSRNHRGLLTESQHYIFNAANPRSTFDDGVEYGLHIRRRPADNAQHLGRCGLMLQGFAQFRVALLQFFEQADVLNGNYRLASKGLKQLYLFLRERPNLLSTDHDRTDGSAFPK